MTIYRYISSFADLLYLKLRGQSISFRTASHFHGTPTRNLHFCVLFVHRYLFSKWYHCTSFKLDLLFVSYKLYLSRFYCQIFSRWIMWYFSNTTSCVYWIIYADYSFRATERLKQISKLHCQTRLLHIPLKKAVNASYKRFRAKRTSHKKLVLGWRFIHFIHVNGDARWTPGSRFRCTPQWNPAKILQLLMDRVTQRRCSVKYLFAEEIQLAGKLIIAADLSCKFRTFSRFRAELAGLSKRLRETRKPLRYRRHVKSLFCDDGHTLFVRPYDPLSFTRLS